MNLERLRDWLELADGPWPPDHYALLGLAPGEGSSEQVEERALERMERLRRYQLPFPEEVTEGMNRLARALDCLCDPEERRRYDAGLGLTPIPDEAVEPELDLPDVLELANEPDEPDVQAPVVPPPLPPPSVGKRGRTRRAADETIALRDEAPPELPRPVAVAERPSRKRVQEDPERRERRKVYAELARLRRVLRVWAEVSAYLTNPEESFASRTNAVALLGALAELRPLLPSVERIVGAPDEPGHLIATLTRQSIGVDMFRSLLPSQREMLAQDCKAAHYLLEDRYRSLREDLQEEQEKGFGRSYLAPMCRHLSKYPEWGLLVLGICSLLIALFRSVPR